MFKHFQQETEKKKTEDEEDGQMLDVRRRKDGQKVRRKKVNETQLHGPMSD